MACVLAWEVQDLAAKFGIEKLGFLTLTFAEHVTDIREAQKRFHSLNTNVLKGRYSRVIGVWERSESKRVHFHLVVVLEADIRSGFRFEDLEQKRGRDRYASASPALKAEWAFWRRIAPRYGFGRTELLPVKSTAEGIARYVGKYVSKHVTHRNREDIGSRVIRFIGYKAGDRKCSAQFAWNTPGGWVWRQKVKRFAERLHVKEFYEIQTVFGPRWAFFLQPLIMAEDISDLTFPDEASARNESETKFERLNRRRRAWLEHREQHPEFKGRKNYTCDEKLTFVPRPKTITLPADYWNFLNPF